MRTVCFLLLAVALTGCQHIDPATIPDYTAQTFTWEGDPKRRYRVYYAEVGAEGEPRSMTVPGTRAALPLKRGLAYFVYVTVLDQHGNEGPPSRPIIVRPQ